MYSKYEISYLFKERGKGVKLNERLLFNHFFNSGAGSASSVYPLVEAQAQRNIRNFHTAADRLLHKAPPVHMHIHNFPS